MKFTKLLLFEKSRHGCRQVRRQRCCRVRPKALRCVRRKRCRNLTATHHGALGQAKENHPIGKWKGREKRKKLVKCLPTAFCSTHTFLLCTNRFKIKHMKMMSSQCFVCATTGTALFWICGQQIHQLSPSPARFLLFLFPSFLYAQQHTMPTAPSPSIYTTSLHLL